MIEAEDPMVRAATALMPFVHRFGLPLNPEDVQEMAYAAVHHFRGHGPLEDIVPAVEAQIDAHEAAMRATWYAMGSARDADQD